MDGIEAWSLAYGAVSILCALVVVIDVLRHPQMMWIMNLVWPLTALYGGPFGLWAYCGIGRRKAAGQGSHRHTDKPFWQAVFTGATHCGAGCAVGDFIGEWIVLATGAFLWGAKLPSKFLVAFVLAYLFGIFFQYFSIAPMRGLGLRDGLIAAVKADTLSLIAYEIGMFAWMAIVQLVLFPGLEPTSWTFWFMMQIAMMLGLATTFPVNWWLLRRGIKEAM